MRRAAHLDDGRYDAFIVWAEQRDNGIALECAITAGAHRGDVVTIVSNTLPTTGRTRTRRPAVHVDRRTRARSASRSTERAHCIARALTRVCAVVRVSPRQRRFSTRSRDARARNDCIASFLALHNWKRVNPRHVRKAALRCTGCRARRRLARASGSGLHGSSPEAESGRDGPDPLGACLRGRRGPEILIIRRRRAGHAGPDSASRAHGRRPIGRCGGH